MMRISVTNLDAKAAPRRIVLLDAAGNVVRELATPKASEVHLEMLVQAIMYSGRTVAAEWFGSLGWVRWMEARR